MKRAATPLAAAGLALGLAFAVWYAAAPRATPVSAGERAPDFALPHSTRPSARGTLAELRGSPVLLARFDSRWPGTPEYLVELEKVHRRLLRDGLVVVGVALDPAAERRALEFVLQNRGVTFTVLLDPEGQATAPQWGTPRDRAETYLIDAGGRVVSVHLEPQRWTARDSLLRLGALLPTPTPTPSPGPLDSPRPGG